MKKAAICFTKDGKALIERLNEELTKAGLEKAKAYISMQGIESDDDFDLLDDFEDFDDEAAPIHTDGYSTHHQFFPSPAPRTIFSVSYVPEGSVRSA